jgi:glycosyltransferase involved in cell wall biosynthesis
VSSDAPRFSVVVPVYNERDSLRELHAEISATLGEHAFEVLYVDDGSTDGSDEQVDEIARADSRARAIHLTRNTGKSAAYVAGFEAARGALVVTLDADLQDDPSEIPAMAARIAAGADLVVGWKQGRFDNEPLKAVPSRFFNALLGLLFGLVLHDSNCGFRVMRRVVSAHLDLYGDLYRFIPQLTAAGGFRVVEHPVRHRRRKFGKSKYGARRFWTGLLDVLTVRFLTRYVGRPLHFFGTVGLAPMVLGLGTELYVVGCKLSGDSFQVHVAAIILGALLLIVGFQCIVTGLIGEMLSAQRKERAPLRAEPIRA